MPKTQAKKNKTVKTVQSQPGYLHGYSNREQERLYNQAQFLEQTVYEKIDFSEQKKVIEIGCGVGAQTKILLRRYPHIHLSSVDLAEVQLEKARDHTRAEIRDGRVSFVRANAEKLPFHENSFDGAFICWMLEHVEKPVEILKEAHRVLKGGGVIYCSEVLNQLFFVDPYSPATLKYWFHFNDHQWNLKGDPFVGAKLGNYLSDAGFSEISLETKVHHYDSRSPKKRAEFIEDWTQLLESGAPELIRAGRVSEEDVKKMAKELRTLKHESDSVIYWGWIQARAVAT